MPHLTTPPTGDVGRRLDEIRDLLSLMLADIELELATLELIRASVRPGDEREIEPLLDNVLRVVNVRGVFGTEEDTAFLPAKQNGMKELVDKVATLARRR